MIALVLLFVVAVGVAGYILSNQRLRFPLVEEKPFVLKAELADAQAVQPGQGQTVRVAGIEIGQIGQVELEDGQAVVELELEPKYEGFIKDDATRSCARRPGLKDMFLEVDPGDGEPLQSGDRIQVENTAPDVDPDEFLSALDSDTRDYLRLLITGAGKGLAGGGGKDLREAFARLGPLHRDLASVSGAVARRRHNLERLVNRYGLLMTELGEGREDIQRLVRASEQSLGAFADEEQDLSGFVARLPGTLRESRDRAREARPPQRGDEAVAERAAARLPRARRRERRAAAARAGGHADRARRDPPVRAPVGPVHPGPRHLVGRGSRRRRPTSARRCSGLNRFFDIGAYNPGGSEGISDACENGGTCTPDERARNEGYMYWLAWVAQNTVSVFSTADAQGPFRRASMGGVSCGTLQNVLGQTGVPDPVVGLIAGTPTVDGLFQTLGACAS